MQTQAGRRFADQLREPPVVVELAAGDDGANELSVQSNSGRRGGILLADDFELFVGPLKISTKTEQVTKKRPRRRIGGALFHLADRRVDGRIKLTGVE